MFDKNKIIKNKLDTIKNPVILELGVNRGRSTKRFIDYIELNGGELYSIDIKDCSNAISSNKWNFLGSMAALYSRSPNLGGIVISSAPCIIKTGALIFLM